MNQFLTVVCCQLKRDWSDQDKLSWPNLVNIIFRYRKYLDEA